MTGSLRCRLGSISGAAVVAFLSIAACSEPAAAPATTRDSAGVSIVESAAPLWSNGTSWRLAERPRVTIGTADGAEEYQLSYVWDALYLGSGTIVVSNSGSSQLRFYDSAGGFIRSAGRQGAGPGEFDAMADLRMWRLPGGLVAVRDGAISRANLFDTAGAFVRTVTFTPPDTGVRPMTVGAFADGSLLQTVYAHGENDQPGQVDRSSVRYLRYGLDGAPISTLARAESAPRYVHRAGSIIHQPYLPLTVEPAVAADSASILVLRGGEPELERFDLGGKLAARIRWGAERRPVTPELFQRYVAADLENTGNPQQKQLYELFYRLPLPLPKAVPAYKDLYVDDTRHIWVERYRLPGESRRVWDVLDPQGRWLGPVELPGRFWLHRAGRRYLLGTQMDSLDVERIQLYDLNRTNP